MYIYIYMHAVHSMFVCSLQKISTDKHTMQHQHMYIAWLMCLMHMFDVSHAHV